MTDTPRAYFACLASYNGGRLHGEWIDLDDGEDAVRDAIAEMLRASPFPNVRVACPTCDGDGDAAGDRAAGVPPLCATCRGDGTVPSAEEYAVHDYYGMLTSFGEYPDVAKLCAYAEALSDLDSAEEREAFGAWVDNQNGFPGDLDAFREEYRGCFTTLAEYAEQLSDDTGMLESMPENLRYYFDFDAFARDMQSGGDVWTHRGDHGLHVFDNH